MDHHREGTRRALVGVEAQDVAVGVLEPGGAHIAAVLGHIEVALLAIDNGAGI